ncbi:MAG TPA: PAS domain-containing protein [Pontibacter sp.]
MPEPVSTAVSPLGPIFRSLPAAYLVMSPDLLILDATDAYVAATASERDKFANRHILDAFPETSNASHQDAKAGLQEALQQVKTNKQPHTLPSIRYDIELPSGLYEERIWETTLWPITDVTGNLQYIVLETKDVTAHRQQEQENTFNRKRLHLLAQATDAVTWEYDVRNKTLCWGGALEQVFGYTPETIPSGKDTWKELIYPDDLARVQESLRQAEQVKSNIWTGKYRFRKADGTYVQILDQRYIIFDSRQHARSMIGSLIDISGNRRNGLEEAENDKRFLHLLEVLPFMAWTAAPNGQILHFNQAWHSFTGMPKGHTDRWVSYVHPEDTANVLTTWHEAIRLGTPFEVEYRILNQYERNYQWFMERAVPMYDEAGKVKLWIGTYTDINGQMQASPDL